MERVHQTIVNIIGTFKIKEIFQGKILSSNLPTIQYTVHTTTQHILPQLVFGRYTILSVNQEANWQLIKQHKHALINVIRKKIAVDNLMYTTLETKSY